MKIAYLMNQHPYISCTFIRREILELEAAGATVARFSIRYPSPEIKDPADLQELEKTRFILNAGTIGLLTNLLRVAVTRPLRFWKALMLTMRIGWRSDRGLLVNLAYLIEACTLLQWLIAEQIQHVHAHFASNPAAVAMLCHELGGPSYSFTTHGPNGFDQPIEIALPEKIRRAAFVVGISEFTRSQLFRWCDYKQWAKIHVVHCGVDELFLEQSPVPLPQEPRFVCVGRLTEQKGHLILIEAVSQLAAAGLKFKLVLVGDGPLRPQIETLLQQLRLQDSVELIGWATNAEVQQQILKAQVMVLPSFAEGLPVVIMEALALGRPVISTYIAGIPELVVPSVSGWLVPSGSSEALAAAMREVIYTPVETLTQMGQAGSDRIVRHHTASTEAQKLLALFRQYCGES
jgi:glycosyltransferase involved in cell wall biosynthesis